MDQRERPPLLNRDFVLRAAVLAGATTLLLTEILSAFEALRRGPLLAGWAIALAAAIAFTARRRPRVRIPRPDPLVAVCVAGVGVVLALTAAVAWASPPNSADAMAYHMPRVIYWAEQASVRFFPTPYLNQVMLQPLTEYFQLHTYLLSGGDRWVNLVQWLASALCALGVASVAKEFGAGARAQALAAVFAITIPPGILASSGAKNDYALALWLVLAVYFALRFRETAAMRDAAFLGLAMGLAMLTKGTAYLFAPWPLAAILLWRFRRGLVAGLALAASLAIVVNAPHYARNYELSGSILGYDSAHGDGLFRWQNETFGWKQTVSNIARNVSEQLGARSERWNQGVYNEVVALHRTIGIGVEDPATTWRWSEYRAPKNANHEADAHARWHLLIALVAFAVWGWRHPRIALYAISLAFGFLVFCAYLKWQPFLARLFLPLFVLSAPVVAACLPSRWWLQLAVVLFLFNNARPSLLENWVRPLKGPRSVFRVDRNTQYFADMVQFGGRAGYEPMVEQVTRSGCRVVGLDINQFQLEYPLQALLRERDAGIQFVHVNVKNASARYRQPVTMNPCAVVCIRCAEGWRVTYPR